MSASANNSIPFVPENTIDPAAGLNESINTIDALLQLAVLTVNTDIAPASPAEGDRHIVGIAPSGAWAGKAGKLARFLDGYWSFYDARLALDLASGILYSRSGAAWLPIQAEASVAVNGTPASAMDFEGAGVAVTDNGDGTVTITISGGGGGGGGMANPMAAANQMIIGGTAGAPMALPAPATAGHVLSYLAGSIQWAAGLLNPMTNAGDLIVGGASGAALRLAGGTNGYVLTMIGGAPAWAPASGGGGASTWGTISGNIADQADLKDALDSKVDTAKVGAANGVAGLDAGGKVPASQLPALGGPASTDDLSEGTSNLYFTAARVRAVVLAGLSVATDAAISATDTVLSGLGKLQAQITALGTALAEKLSLSGGTLTGALNNAPAVTLASASTVNIGAAAANTINIAGTTTITSLGTIAAGAQRTLIFGGALTLTHSATKLILPGAANIVTAVGDVAGFESLGAGNWKCVGYVRANGRALVTDASSLVWGGIGGVLANQADLQAALDSKLNAALADFTILYPNGGSAAAPANIVSNTRYVLPNPFPGYAVICILQVQVAGGWGTAGWYTDGSTARGAIAGQLNDSVIVQTAIGSLIASGGTTNSGAWSGTTHPGNIASPTTLPARVLVWKVKGSL